METNDGQFSLTWGETSAAACLPSEIGSRFVEPQQVNVELMKMTYTINGWSDCISSIVHAGVGEQNATLSMGVSRPNYGDSYVVKRQFVPWGLVSPSDLELGNIFEDHGCPGRL